MSRALAVMTCLAFLAVPLAADEGHGKAKGKHKQEEEREHHGNRGVVVFAQQDRGVLHDHFLANPSGLPPGLAKRNGNLPPGLAKQLQRNGHLPPGLEKKIYPFPVELERRLQPLAPDCRRGFIGGRAIIYNSRTSVILDIFAPQ